MPTSRNIVTLEISHKNITMPDGTLSQELTPNESETKRNRLRTQTLKQMKGLFTGLIGEEQSIQTIKSERIL